MSPVLHLLLLLLHCRFDTSGAGDASTPEQLDALMHEIGSNKQRYEAMLAWKHRKVGCSTAVDLSACSSSPAPAAAAASMAC
jgi:hypothetical protein